MKAVELILAVLTTVWILFIKARSLILFSLLGGGAVPINLGGISGLGLGYTFIPGASSIAHLGFFFGECWGGGHGLSASTYNTYDIWGRSGGWWKLGKVRGLTSDIMFCKMGGWWGDGGILLVWAWLSVGRWRDSWGSGVGFWLRAEMDSGAGEGY